MISGAGIVALRRAGAGFASDFGNPLHARLGAAQHADSAQAHAFGKRPVLLAPEQDPPQKFSLAGGASSPSSAPDAASPGLWARGMALALYGSYAAGPWNFSSSASLAWGSNHMERKLVIGALRRTARSDFDSRTLSAYGEATCDMPTNGWRLQPLAGLSLGRSKAGFDAGSLRLEPRRVWAHEFGDLNTPMTAQFQGAASASPFQISAAALKRDTLILGLGASGEIGKGLTLFADLQVEHNARQRNLAVLVGLRSRW